MKKILALYDADEAYSRQLAEYINRKEGNPFRALTFSSMEKLSEYSRDDPIEVLLTSEAAESEHVQAKYKFTLTRQPCVQEDNCVWKYQAAGQLLSRLTTMTASDCVEKELQNITMLGVYSPLGNCGKTTFALLMGQILARNQPVLYINLEEFSSLSEELAQDAGGNFSDAYFYYVQGTLKDHIRELIGHWHELDILPGAGCPEDLRDMSFDSFEGFISCIAGLGIYETIILDAGSSLRLGADFFSLCKTVYVPRLGDGDSGKMKSFNEWLSRNRRRGLECRIQEVCLPQDVRSGSAAIQLEYRLWNDCGDYIRDLCRRETGAAI